MKKSAWAEEHTPFFRYISFGRSAKSVVLCVSLLELLFWVALSRRTCDFWFVKCAQRLQGNSIPQCFTSKTIRRSHLWVARRMLGALGAVHATRVLLLSSSRCQATRRFTQTASEESAV